MQHQTVPQTTVDLSHAGVDTILSALALAGQYVHYNETDGDTFLDVWLTDLDATTATILSWRDNGEGWLLRSWESFSGDSKDTPDRKWPITAGSPAEVARDVASILTGSEQTETAERPGLVAAMAAGRALLAAGWRYDSTSPMADDTTIRTLLHPSGRQIDARTVDGGEQTALTMTGLTLEQAAGAVTGAGLAGPAEPTSPIGDVGKCPQCGKQSRSYSRGCSGCGFGVPTEKPDYWLALADELRQAADRIATLAGTAPKPSWVCLSVQMAAPGNTDPTVIEHIDTLAAAFGVEATTQKSPGGFYEHTVTTSRGDLRLALYGYVPAPEDPEKAALAARVAELEAKLAEDGAR